MLDLLIQHSIRFVWISPIAVPGFWSVSNQFGDDTLIFAGLILLNFWLCKICCKDLSLVLVSKLIISQVVSFIFCVSQIVYLCLHESFCQSTSLHLIWGHLFQIGCCQKSSWHKLVEKIEGLLSIGWRLTLVNAILSAISACQVFLPFVRMVFNYIDKLHRSFFCQSSPEHRRMHLCNWSIFCKSKSQGGLGILNL